MGCFSPKEVIFLSDLLPFVKRFVSKPTQVGSIIPSSKYLCRHMMRQIPWDKTQTIVELGPGTGVFTKEILRRKARKTRFFVVERDPTFQNMLRNRFPGLMIRNEAVQLPLYMKELGIHQVDAIVSGLPFAVLPDEKREQILDRIVDSLVDDGIFVTFQYSLQLKDELEKRFERVEITFTMLNLPPAFIYTCYKHR